MEPGNEAGKSSLEMRLGSGAWEQGWEVEPGNEAGEWSLGIRLGITRVIAFPTVNITSCLGSTIYTYSVKSGF